MKRNSQSSTYKKQSTVPTIFSDVSDKFAIGSIECIKLRNFMTFEKMTISPSPGLNLIIGPNGSGKSTIVCAIGLGLGATPNVLARASKPCNFIRHSCDEAKIKILLTGNPSFWVCRRISADNSTQWRIRNINGKWKVTSSADVLQRIQNLHIQLDNLCMFLPQERVKEFSTLKPSQLLVETEKAINQEAYEQHKALLQGFKNQLQVSLKVKDDQNNLQKYEALLNQMHGDVVRLRQVEECKLNIEKHQKVIPWIQYQTEKIELKEIKKNLREEIKLYKEAKEAIAPLQDQIEKLKQQKGSSNKAKDKFDAAKKELTKFDDASFQNMNKFQTIKSKLEYFQKDNEKRQEKIDKYESVLEQASAKTQSSDTQSKEQLDEDRKALVKEIQKMKIRQTEFQSNQQAVDQKIKSKHQKIEEINRRVKNFESQKTRLLNHIGQRLRRGDVVEVYRYIQEHKNNFVGSVYGPVCTEVRFDDARNANILQMVVENHILYSFLVEEKEDQTRLYKFLEERKLNQITVLRAGDDETARSQRPRPPDLSRYGFTKYVDSLFHAPEAVKKMLISVASLDLIPVGSGKEARDNVQRLVQTEFIRSKINRYFVDNLLYIMYKSRGDPTGRNVTTVSNQIRSSNIWRETAAADEDVKNLREKKEKIEAKIQRLKEEKSRISDEANAFSSQLENKNKELNEIKDKLRERISLEDKLKRIREKIDQLKREGKDIPAKEEEYKRNMDKLIKESAIIDAKKLATILEMVEALKEKDKISYKEQAIDSKLLELEEKLVEERQKYSSQENKIRELDAQKKKKQQEVDQIKAEAEEKCPLTEEENQNLIKEMPNDLEVLKSELSKLETRLRSLSHIDPTIASRFAEAEKNKNKTQEELDKHTKELETLSEQNEKGFNEWKQVVSKDVTKINNAFQELMKTCDYRGEVQLDYDDKTKLDTYKLNLLVAFNRSSNLKVLSSTRQSGGEKSVSTLLYLLALQDCTMFPFRVVDEINQGMDEVNDRNTFFQVMSYAMRRNQASQYFLVTPKLLPQLDLMEGVTVLVVMNGPYIDSDLNLPITFESALPHEEQ